MVVIKNFLAVTNMKTELSAYNKLKITRIRAQLETTRVNNNNEYSYTCSTSLELLS